MKGPYSGEVQCMLKAGDGSLFLGTDMSGVYRSTDGGASWAQRNSGILDMNIWSLALEPDGHLLALTYQEPYIASYSPMLHSPWGRIFRSTNLGSSWALLDTVATGTRLFVNSLGYIWHEIYSDNYSGLNRSTNGGTIWTSQALGSGTFIGSFAMDADNNLYLGVTTAGGGGSTGISKSTNHGVNWTQMTTSVAPRFLEYKTGGFLFAATGAGVSRINTDGTGYTVLDNTWQATSFAFAVSGNVYASGSDGSVRKSTNNGASWTTIRPVSVGARRVFCPAGTDLYADASSFLLRTTDGGTTWGAITDGFSNTFVPSLLCSRTNVLYAGTTSSIWKTSDKGSTWSVPYSMGAHSYDYLHFAAGTHPPYYVWALSAGSGTSISAVQEWKWYQSVTAGFDVSYGHVFTTANDWSSSIDQRTELSGYLKPGAILPYAAVVGKDDVVYIGGKTGFGKLSAGVFSRVNGTLTGKTVFALARDNKDTLFAGTLDFGVFRSATHGDTWSAVSSGLADLGVYSLALDSTGRIYAGTGTGLYASTNNGNTWIAAAGFPSTKVQAIALGSGGHVYAATTSYVWFSSNYGGSPWTQLTDGLPLGDVSSIAVGPDGDVYAGTWGGGVYRRPEWVDVEVPATPRLVYPANLDANVPKTFAFLWRRVPGAITYQLQMGINSMLFLPTLNDTTLTDTTRNMTLAVADTFYWRVRAKNAAGYGAYSAVNKFGSNLAGVETDLAIPKEFHLGQNYPNPFNPSTTISFSLPKDEFVRLEVLTLLGEQVATILNERCTVGYHSVRFDGGALASGIYLYRMRAGTFVETRKLLLLR
jgi:photosystem II stability/assembly factor-like uncharacterized protein